MSRLIFRSSALLFFWSRPPRRAIQNFTGPTTPRSSPSLFAILRTRSFKTVSIHRQNVGVSQSQGHNESRVTSPHPESASSVAALTACPGCGAPAQTVDSSLAGYYDFERNAVKRFFKELPGTSQGRIQRDQDVFAQALENASSETLRSVGVTKDALRASAEQQGSQQPFCDRCHNLLHHQTGVPVIHPSIQSVEDTIAESPWKYNHIYHVVDSADFPMSLIPRIHASLSIAPQRSKNRRAKHAEHRSGTKTEVSFVVTRSDLLAPRKEQVDQMMPYLKEVLRDALGRAGRDLRLGNVRCVSAMRGWWTKNLKEDIWTRGGAGWMVGKVNVGKSNLFEVVFPKNRKEDIDFQTLRAKSLGLSTQSSPEFSVARQPGNVDLEGGDLLPPPRPEVPYPAMPTVSALPGTTASPIRLPFGNGKGELIDLPGLERSGIENWVMPDYRARLIMKKRPSSKQISLRSSHHLIIGGLVRIRPVTKELVFLAYNFTPLDAERKTDEKLNLIYTGVKAVPTSFMTDSEVWKNLQLAGRFKLKHDVTRERAGPLTARDGLKLKPEKLPFQVCSIDILIESVGWVEIVCQVRRRSTSEVGRQSPQTATVNSADENNLGPHHETVHGGSSSATLEENLHPEVEVFSPEGKFIGSRPPLGAWKLKRNSVSQSRR